MQKKYCHKCEKKIDESEGTFYALTESLCYDCGQKGRDNL